MSYTNVAGGSLLPYLRDILFTEFAANVPVFYTPPDKERAPEWFEVRLLASEPVERSAGCTTRVYHLEVVYLRRETGEDHLSEYEARLEMAARMERLLVDNCVNKTATWFAGSVGAIDYQYRPEGREEDNLVGVRIEWSVNISESL